MKEVTVIGVDLAKERVPAARRGRRRVGRVPQEAVAAATPPVHVGASALHPEHLVDCRP